MSKYPTIWVACPPRREGQPGKSTLRKPWARNRCFSEQPEEVELTPMIRSGVFRLIAQGSLREVPPPEKQQTMPMVNRPETEE